MRVLTVLALLLSGCTSINVEKLPDGTFKGSVSRFWSDVAIIANPETGEFSYSSDAETTAAMQFNQLLLDALLRRTP